jgi:two-component system, chemotaxis family, chemotaxis protein CheY
MAASRAPRRYATHVRRNLSGTDAAAYNSKDILSAMNAQYSCLVVEDSPMMRQLLVLALSRLKSVHVTEADDGVDGLRKLAAGKFDIIMTDINMPIMDGLKLVKRVRSDPMHKDVPIIVITTEGSSEDRQRALQLGANAYITKPIQAPQVIAKVKELLKIDG